MKHIEIEHETHYRYASDVILAQHLAYLRPAQTSWQRLLSHALHISPPTENQTDEIDAFGNQRTFFTMTSPHRELLVQAHSKVQKKERYANFEPTLTPSWESVRAQMIYSLEQPFYAASEFAWSSPYIPWLPELKDYALLSFAHDAPIGVAAMDLCRRVFLDFVYSSGATEVHTPLSQAFAQKRGVCQDFSHIMIGCLRTLGLPARYVSGYLLTEPPEGQPKMRGADASHAWVSVYCPGAAGNWLDLDPTNQTIADLSHVVVAQGRDFGDVSPLKGVIRGGGTHQLTIGVTAEEVPGS